MKKFLLLFCWLCMLGWIKLSAQKVVTGQVVDVEGIPLIGVNILAEDTDKGTITDFEGNYELTVPPESRFLLFSYIGYKNHREEIGGRSVIDVTMAVDAQALDEVIVVGYGTKKKRDVIGSVSTVKSEDLTKAKTTSFVEGLQGRASGVQVSSQSGVPGASTTVKIRGINSLSIGTNPLWIVDGMPVYSGSSLNSSNGATNQDPMSLINPNDIESIQVLKDAAATAIYGSRGSNGVIIITTKSGTKGKGSFSLDYSSGITDLVRTPEDIGFTNTSEWFELVETARTNSNNGVETPYDPNSVLNLFKDDPIARLSREEAMQINTDWFDQILQQGSFHDLNLSGSTGFEKGTLYVSFAYRNDNSVLSNNELERYSVRANLQLNPVNNLQVETRLNFSYTNNDRVKQQVGGAIGNNSGGNSAGFGNANRNALPWYPIYNSDHVSGYWNPLSGNNLAAAIDRDLLVDQVQSYRGLGGLALEYSIPWVKGLAARAEGSFDLIQTSGLNWIASTLRENGSFAADESIQRRSFVYNTYLKYNREFDNIGINIATGVESQEDNSYYRLMEGQNLTGTYQEIGSPQDLLTIRGGLNGEEYLRAFFGRADVKLWNRYFLGFSFRRDGSSKFNEAYRWGTFPAVSAGWVVSDEPFWQSRAFTFIKLRGSYGQTGNKSIPSNRFVTTYANRADWRYGPSDVIQEGTRITNIGVPSLTWETTSSYDAGIDFGLWEGRVTGSFAYYFQDVTDLLLSSPLATSAGLQSNRIWGNIGDMRNWGFEFEVTSSNIRKADFSWKTDFNITTNRNKVLQLTPDLDRSGRGLINGNRISKTGGRLLAYYMAEDAGVDSERGVNMIWEIDIDHFEATGETIKTGRKIPATLNNLQNHRIIHQDKTSVPTVFGGLNNTVQFKGIDLSVFFNFSLGNYLYDYEEQRTTDVQYGQVVLRKDLIDNTWTPDNPNAKYPELRWQGAYPWSWDPEVENPDSPTGKGDWIESSGNYKNETVNWSKYLYKADYVRLRNVQIGYNFPNRLTQRWKVENLRIYVSGTNIWTWSPHYEGWDPESGGSVLPPLKVWAGGLSVKF